MDVTSDEIRSSRFQGTRHVYDRREVDAFLHRTAATLEVYERKLAVTQAHVQSLEKALDLAHSRVRNVRDREARIAELEAALAAAQHNYETAMSMVGTGGGVADEAVSDAVVEAQRHAEKLIDEARQEALLIRAEAERATDDAAERAAGLVAAAQAEADELLTAARREQEEMLAELTQTQREAEATLEAELAEQRAAAVAQFAGEAAAAEAEQLERLSAVSDNAKKVEQQVRRAADKVARAEDKASRAESKAAEAEERAALAEERAADAEQERLRLTEDIERMKAAAETERQRLMEDAEQMVEEAVSRAEADRNRMLEETQTRLAAVEAESLERLQALAATAGGNGDEAVELRRQLAQMRTALSNIHARFSKATGPEELELAAALVDLDLHDVDAIVDLTSLHDPREPTSIEPSAEAAVEDRALEEDEAPPDVKIKSKWAQAEQVPAGTLRGGRPDREDQGRAGKESPHGERRTWRDNVSAREKPAGQTVSEEEESLGFYERRLAGLRARLDQAIPKDR